MKKLFLAAGAVLALAATPAAAQQGLTTIKLNGNVPIVCYVANTTFQQGSTIDVIFADLANTDSTQKVAAPGISMNYLCNNPAGFTRTFTSANGGKMVRSGTQGGAGNEIPYTIQHGGGSGLGFAEQDLTQPRTTSLGGSSAFMSGQTGGLTLRAFGVKVPGASNLATTNAFAGNYADVITVAITAN